MKKTFLALAGSTVLFLGVAFAHGDEEFEKWMKETNADFASLRKTVAAKDGPATAATAEKLSALFDHVGEHFEHHKWQDAIDLAKTAHGASTNLAAAAKAGDWDKAGAEMKTLGGTCQNCHAAHRVKNANGEYEMK